MTRGPVLLLALLAPLLLARPARAAPEPAPALTCSQAAALAETGAGIPPGLLLAIGIVESGRADAAGRRLPWPWAVQSGGTGSYLPSAEAAVAAVLALRAAGTQSIDIGCFQINLLHHPRAFPDLATGFDPLANAQAAARFLAALRLELGGWEHAVAAYHSRTSPRGAAYRDLVLATWRGTPPSAAASAAVTGIRVWGPAGEIGGTAIAQGGAAAPRFQGGAGQWIRMPRVVTASAR